MRTVVAVLPSIGDAQHVAHHLEELGVSPKDVSIVAGPDADAHELKLVERARRTNGAAAATGAVRGAIVGLVIGFAMLSVPGVGPFLNGDFTATLAAAVAIVMIAGTLIGLCWNMGLSHEEAPLYEEALREKGTVVAAHIAPEREASAVAMLQAHSARAVHAAEDAWAASGCCGGCHNEHTYPCDSTVTAH
jgi:hypothetical protein